MEYLRPDSTAYLQNILDEPEQPALRRLTALVAHLLQAPVAYMALVGADNAVVTRIGEGTDYAPVLKSVRPDLVLEEPQLIRDSELDLPESSDFADLRFAASVPLRSTSGMHLGVLVIADHQPRPGFSDEDSADLSDLAAVLAGKIELRMIASMALESELSLADIEQRGHDIVDCAPVPLIYRRMDGVSSSVNQAWLDFSGRTRERELATGWESLILPSHRQAVMAEYWRSLEALRPFAAEAPFLRHDGQYRWVLAKGAPQMRQDGSCSGYVVCLVDISEISTGRLLPA
jgi:PAS domain S-box-containing protein